VKVFISWSGSASYAVALVLKDWFPKVLQGVQAFVSAKDIDKGANWTVELTRELEDTDFGVICLTPENLSSPWLNYEAGAIAKSVASRVCPILHGVRKSDVNPPIAQLQMTDFDIDEIKLLMRSMNKTAGGHLASHAVDEAVDVWWPQLVTSMGRIPVSSITEKGEPSEPKKPEVSTAEMVAEILHRMRDLDSRIMRVENRSPPPYARDGLDEKGLLTRLEREVVNLMRQEGLGVSQISVYSTGVDIHTGQILPTSILGDLRKGLAQAAKRAQAGIRIIGTDRTVIFDNNGLTDEPPF
jgi:hypothetical protein